MPHDEQQISTPEDYATFARELYATNIISDPWIAGQERFRLEPVVLNESVYAELRAAGEAIGRAYEELAEIIWNQPSLLDEYFHLTPWQKLMWLASRGRWHGIARLDLFILADGAIRVCEMNSDTPSGEAETVLINGMLHPRHPGLTDPNRLFEERFMEMLIQSRNAASPERVGTIPSVGILYPTDLPEDLSMIAIYQQWLESRGMPYVLGSPFNIHPLESGGIALFEMPIDIMIRHYKTDWWGERFPAWKDGDPYNDPDPLDIPLRLALDADAAGTVAIVNPFGAVITQNKLTMAFLWNNIERFSAESRAAIERYMPPTHRLTDIDAAALPKEEWVLKSDYGCEGDEVILGRAVTDEIWAQSLAAAIPERWILQGYFDAAPIEGDMVPNYGLYLIGGEAAGIFTRLSSKATDYTAVVAPTFIRPMEME
ncbi:MAG: glutathionylspermidine synthase family protein [Candidatus Kapaibacterium sp.]